MEKFKRLRLIGTLVVLTGLLFVLFKKKSLKNILQYLGAALIGFALAWFFKPNKPAMPMATIEVVEKYIDTCYTHIDCSFSYEDSLAIYRKVKFLKGRVHVRTTKPRIENKIKKDSVYYTNFHQSYKEHLLTANIDLTLRSTDSMATIDNFEFTYAIDTLKEIEIREKTVTNTIVLDSIHTVQTVLKPVESKYQQYGIGIEGMYNNGLQWSPEAYIRFKNNIEIGAGTIHEKKKVKGGRINIRIPLFKNKK